MNPQTPCTQCPLRETGGFSAHTETEIEFIQRIRKRQTRVGAGVTLFREGDDGKELFTLVSGWAFRYRALSDGRRQILNFLLPGDFIGLQHQLGKCHPNSVETVTESTLCVFSSEHIWDLYRSHPPLGFDITWLCANEGLIVDENLVSVGRRSAGERIAMLMIHLYKRAERIGLVEANGLRLPLNQQHIADALGLSLVHTNKTLKRLQTAGLYTLKDGFLKLGNPAAVARMADYYALPVRPRPLI